MQSFTFGVPKPAISMFSILGRFIICRTISPSTDESQSEEAITCGSDCPLFAL
jgi:hypothetical protein